MEIERQELWKMFPRYTEVQRGGFIPSPRLESFWYAA